jgi:hypothetical protein
MLRVVRHKEGAAIFGADTALKMLGCTRPFALASAV